MVAPGQWAHIMLNAPQQRALQPGVPHPFTVVPGPTPDTVQFFIKEEGPFTQNLARVIESGSLQNTSTMTLQGPYGSPPAFGPHGAAVFVLGGVGVTPSLS